MTLERDRLESGSRREPVPRAWIAACLAAYLVGAIVLAAAGSGWPAWLLACLFSVLALPAFAVLSLQARQLRDLGERMRRDNETLHTRLGDAAAQLEAARQEARASGHQLALAMEELGVSVLTWDVKADAIRIEGALPRALDIAGSVFNGTLNDLKTLLHPDDVPTVTAALENCLEDRSATLHTRSRIEAGDQTVHTYDWAGRIAERRSDGHPQRVHVVLADETARANAEHRWQAAEAMLEAMSATVPVGLLVVDDQMRCPRWNEAAAQILDVNPASGNTQPMGLDHLFPVLAEDIVDTAIKTALQGESSDLPQVELNPGNGRRLTVTLRCVPLHLEHGPATALVVITDRTTDTIATHAARTASQTLHEAVSACQLALVTWYPERNILELSDPNGLLKPGHESPDTPPPTTLNALLERIHPTHREPLAAAFQEVRSNASGQRTVPAQVRPTQYGTPRWLEVTIFPRLTDRTADGISAILREVTVLRQLRSECDALSARLRYAEALESAGLLAATVAEDMTAALTAVRTSGDLLAAGLPDDLRDHALQTFSEATANAASLTAELLEATAHAGTALHLLDLSELAEVMAEDLRKRLPGQARLITRCPRDLPRVLADAEQMRTLIRQLTSQAAAVISPADGRIDVATGVRYCRTDFLRDAEGCPTAPQGRYVFLQIADNRPADRTAGAGAPGRTSRLNTAGLGLVSSIARAHGGVANVASSNDRTRVVTVFLPALTDDDMRTMRPTAATADSGAQDAPHALVVDTCSMLTTAITNALQTRGMVAQAVTNGAKAAIMATGEQKPDLVILGMRIQDCDPLELAATLRSKHPDQPMLLLTAEHNRAAEHLAAASQGVRCLKHPFGLEDLLAAVSALLPDTGMHNQSFRQPGQGRPQ